MARTIDPERLAAEALTFTFLRERDFYAAAKSVAKFEIRQPTARGIGIDWSAYPRTGDLDELATVFATPPTILRGIKPDALEQVRLGAGMHLLWGAKPRRAWLPRDIDTGIRLDGDAASRMLVFFAYSQRNLANMRNIRTRVRISATVDSCDSCKRLAGNIYSLSSVPEIPHAECIHPKGCRCVVTIA